MVKWFHTCKCTLLNGNSALIGHGVNCTSDCTSVKKDDLLSANLPESKEGKVVAIIYLGTPGINDRLI